MCTHALNESNEHFTVLLILRSRRLGYLDCGQAWQKEFARLNVHGKPTCLFVKRMNLSASAG